MSPSRPILLLLMLMMPALAGCNAWHDQAEFAPPMSRWPATLPSPTAADAPPPPTRAVYCYRSLASVDCFNQKQENRYMSYMGVYPASD